jgi:hypothetical protein
MTNRLLSDEACKFSKCLKSRREEEGSEFEMDCAVDREDADVTWFVNDVEITPRTNTNFEHYEFIVEGRKR